MVAIATAVWSLAPFSENDEWHRLGDSHSLKRFLNWCDDAGVAECLLLPLNTSLIDVRMHCLRFMFLTEMDQVLDAGGKRVEKSRFCSGKNAPKPFLFERCPYYCVSAFALNPVYVNVGMSENLETIIVQKYKSLIADEWVFTWIQKTCRLVMQFNKYVREDTDLIAEWLVHRKEDGYGIPPKLLNTHQAFFDWIASTQYWCVDFAVWEALSDFNSIKIYAEDPDVYSHTVNWNKWKYGSRYSKHLAEEIMTVEIHDGLMGGDPPSAVTEPTVTLPGLTAADRTNLRTAVVFSLWSQYRLDKQWRKDTHENRCKLIGDIPYYVAYCSADVWSRPQLFQIEQDTLLPRYVSGLPPDYWSETGQLWSTPVYDWATKYSDILQFWISRFQRNWCLFDYSRVDHYRAFADYWRVPRNSPAIDGSWEPGPGPRIFKDIFCLTNTCSTRFVVEDLGEQSSLFEGLRKKVPFSNMCVLQFELEGWLNNPPPPTPAKGNAGGIVKGIADDNANDNANENANLDDANTVVKSDPWPTDGESPTQPLPPSPGPDFSPSSVLFSSTHDNPPLQKWLDTNLSPTQKLKLADLTRIPAKVLDSCVGGRTLTFWALTQTRSQGPTVPRCFLHEAKNCLPPISRLVANLPDLLSEREVLNVPGTRSGNILWRYRLSKNDYRILVSQPFSSHLAAVF